MATYHSNDFHFTEWAEEARATKCGSLPAIVESISNDVIIETTDDCQSSPATRFANGSCDEERSDHQRQTEQEKQWDGFFCHHKSGDFFKPRRYLAIEFQKYFADDTCRLVLEVGCGHGCSMFPLLDTFKSFQYIATDFSSNALRVLRTDPLATEYHHRISTAQFDVLDCNAGARVLSVKSGRCSNSSNDGYDIMKLPKPDVILCVFVLSAIHHDQHLQALRNIASLMNDRSVILFRDYGVFDMTMFRHKRRFGEWLFERNDGTLAYYFSTEYMAFLLATADMEAVELEYATVQTTNRKTSTVMRRVFVHGVFRLKRHVSDSACNTIAK